MENIKRYEIRHPELGVLKVSEPEHSAPYWESELFQIGSFPYKARFVFWPDPKEGLEALIQFALGLVKRGDTLALEIEGHLYREYTDSIRDEYLGYAKDPRYAVKESDLPPISKAREIWQVITGMADIDIADDMFDKNSIPRLSLSFQTTFDKNHDFAMRYRHGKFYECMMDG